MGVPVGELQSTEARTTIVIGRRLGLRHIFFVTDRNVTT